MGPDAGDQRAHALRVAALPLASLYERLLKKANLWGFGGKAEDAVQGAMTTLVREGGGSWDYENDPNAWRFLLKTMNEQGKVGRRRDQRRRTDLDAEAGEESPPSSDSGPARTLLAREEATWARDELRKRLANAPIALRMIDAHMADGYLEPAELAEQLGEDVGVIYRWNAKIVRAMDHVRRDWDARNVEAAS